MAVWRIAHANSCHKHKHENQTGGKPHPSAQATGHNKTRPDTNITPKPHQNHTQVTYLSFPDYTRITPESHTSHTRITRESHEHAETEAK